MWLPKGLILRVPRTQVSSHTLTLGTAHPREDPCGSEGPGPSLPPGPRSRSSHWGPAGHSSDTCFVVFSHSKSSQTQNKSVFRDSFHKYLGAGGAWDLSNIRAVSALPGARRACGSAWSKSVYPWRWAQDTLALTPPPPPPQGSWQQLSCTLGHALRAGWGLC